MFLSKINDIFWFVEQSHPIYPDKTRLILKLKKQGQSHVAEYEVPETTRLYKHMLEGNDFTSDLRSFPLYTPTMITVKDKRPLLIFSYFKFGGYPELCFYDLPLKREIAVA